MAAGQDPICVRPGSLGWGLFRRPLGAKCAAGDRKVICFTGDGGFYYHLAELESARRCHIPVVILVNNNSGFGQNLTGVHRLQAIVRTAARKLIRFGPTDFTRGRPQLRAVRRYPCRAGRARSPAALQAGNRRQRDRSWSMSSLLWSHAPLKPWAPPRLTAVRARTRAACRRERDRPPLSWRRPGGRGSSHAEA